MSCTTRDIAESLAKLVSDNTGMDISFICEEEGQFLFQRKVYKSYTRIGLNGDVEHVGRESDKWEGPGEKVYYQILCNPEDITERNLIVMAENHLTRLEGAL